MGEGAAAPSPASPLPTCLSLMVTSLKTLPTFLVIVYSLLRSSFLVVTFTFRTAHLVLDFDIISVDIFFVEMVKTVGKIENSFFICIAYHFHCIAIWVVKF